MKDYQAQAEKLGNAAEWALIRDFATDQAKRELFDRLSKHLTVLADQVELALTNVVGQISWRENPDAECLPLGDSWAPWSPELAGILLGYSVMPLYRMLERLLLWA